METHNFVSTGGKMTSVIVLSSALEWLFPVSDNSGTDTDKWIQLAGAWVQLSIYVHFVPRLSKYILGSLYSPFDNYIYAAGFLLQPQMIQKILNWYNSLGITAGAPWSSGKEQQQLALVGDLPSMDTSYSSHSNNLDSNCSTCQ